MRSALLVSLGSCVLAATGAKASLAAQDPLLTVAPRALSNQSAQTTVGFSLASRPGDLFVLLVDFAPGSASLFGSSFDLAFSPGLMVLEAGFMLAGAVSAGYPVSPQALPLQQPVLFQAATWNPQQGFGSLLVSNVDSLAVHGAPQALVFSFENLHVFPQPFTGRFDRTVSTRLQALPSSIRTVRPLPPQAWPQPLATAQQPMHPAGARFQLAFRAEDLGADGVEETLISVRWRPLFGTVTSDTYPQFELRAALTDAVPDYRLDPLTLFPLAPASGLSTTFAANAIGGSESTLYSGPYTIDPQLLLPSGYVDFPIAQVFDYDGESTLLLETRCQPRPGLGAPTNFQTPYRLGTPLQTRPTALLYAVGGVAGEPLPLPPAAAGTGTGDAVLYDWQLEFLRSTSVALSPWNVAFAPQLDYGTPIAIGYTPPGATLVIEYRGSASPTGAAPTVWSSSPDVADGLPFLQFRVTMTAGSSVPWLDTLIVPVE